MARPKRKHHTTPDFRHRVSVPLPPVAEIEHQLWTLQSPSLLAPRLMERRDPRKADRVMRMRARVLTLPVMVALIVSLVWRRLGAVAEVRRVLAQEGLLWVEPLEVSEQAISKRLDTLRERFPLMACAAGSTLEALRKKTPALQEMPGLVLAGRMMVLVEAFGHRPVWQCYTEDAAANDKRFTTEILGAVPPGGLLIFDLGFFSFLWFDAFTAAAKFFVTRLRQKTAYKTVRVLNHGPYYRDELIQLGQYRSNPCHHPLRLVSVLWQGQWYRYLTNVLDPSHLSARQVCELYRRRWRIEDAFLLTKRVLDLAYLWTASANGVQLQIYATLIFYAVLLNLCHHVAQALSEPLDRISVEMVFRALYHFSRAVQRGEAGVLVEFLATHAALLGLVKRWRKRDRDRQQEDQLVWGSS